MTPAGRDIIKPCRKKLTLPEGIISFTFYDHDRMWCLTLGIGKENKTNRKTTVSSEKLMRLPSNQRFDKITISVLPHGFPACNYSFPFREASLCLTNLVAFRGDLFNWFRRVEFRAVFEIEPLINRHCRQMPDS